MDAASKRSQSQMEGYEFLTGNDFSGVSDAHLQLMQDGVDEMLAVLGEATEIGYHVLANVLASSGEEPFSQWQHYPPGDIQDSDSGSIWFYHAHSEDEIARPWNEHGHFHLFRYTEKLRPDAAALALPAEINEEKGGLCHLVAVSFDPNGLPVRIFTTNRWVSGEWMYPAKDVIPLLDEYAMVGKDYELTSRWLCALLKLYRPQIEWALHERDRKIAELGANNPDFAEDKAIEVLSAVEFDLAAQIDGIEAEVERRKA